jgi:predicted RNA-binding Zn-ribbon protein involved in translation (DUF1610 family)
MKIKEMIEQDRRDFAAIFICESCGYETAGKGYDDEYFHGAVIPNTPCPECGKVSPDTYVPQKPRYEASVNI